MPRPSTALARELRSIRTSFRQIATSFSRIARILTATRKTPRMTSAYWGMLKLQGKYMGTMRGLPARKRAQVKRIRAAKGIRAAIKAAERMAS